MATLPPVLCARRAAKRRATRISSASSTTTRKTRFESALALPSATAPASDDPAPGGPAAGALPEAGLSVGGGTYHMQGYTFGGLSVGVGTTAPGQGGLGVGKEWVRTFKSR